uniref:Metalloendopeptidase n=1 Tax=Strongyloides venezuelensis TaxID=75913 RepID=A0A0K0FTJ3_STRVS
MKNNIIIIILLLFCFTFTASLLTQDINVPKENKGSLEITKLAMNIIKEVEELTEERNAMEQSGLLQEDEMLTKEQAEEVIEDAVKVARECRLDLSNLFSNSDIIRRKRKIEVKENAKWEFPIKYYIQEANETLVEISLKLIENERCIRFHKLYFPSFGIPGKSPNQFQDVSTGQGRTTIRNIQHATMHALGSTHKQCRADRNHYLKITKQNIGFIAERNFRDLNISNSTTYNIKYDYGSDMHFAVDSFTKNGEPTMLPKNLLFFKTLGVDSSLTFLYVMLLNLYYCSDNSLEKIKCYNRDL